MDPLWAAVICLSVGFFLYKDVTTCAKSHVIIAAEHTQSTSGNKSIWSARVLAAVPSLGKFFCCFLVELPFLHVNLRNSFILCESWCQVFLRFFTEIILTERATLRSRLSSLCYVFAFVLYLACTIQIKASFGTLMWFSAPYCYQLMSNSITKELLMSFC